MRRMALFVMVMAVVGCQAKLKSESVVSLDPGMNHFTTVDAITKAQTVNVSATANSGQFNVYVFLEKDKAEVEKEVMLNKVPAKALVHQLKVSEANLQAAVPGNEKAVILLTSGDGKKAEVKLKLTN